MAVANIAWLLASAGKSVIVLDWDLEAPGLHRYFRPFLIDKELTSSEGIIDFIIDFCDEAIRPAVDGEQLPPDWYVEFADIARHRLSIDYEGFPSGGKIDFIPAGQQGPTYATRVNSFNWQDFYQRLGGGAFIEATRERLRTQYDYVLVDSRTGVSDTAGICTVQLPDTLAIFFTYNNQSILGAAAVAESVADQRRQETRGRHRFRILPVPTRVDQTERDKLDARKAFARVSFDPFLEHISSTFRLNYWDNVEIPYVPWFAYEEVLAPFRDNIGDPKTVLASMKRIADFLVQPEIDNLESASLISPEKKQAILSEFAATPVAAQPEAETTLQSESPLEKQIRFADAAYLSLSESERDDARSLWLRLVRVPQLGERIENSKVRVPQEDLNPNQENIVARFVAAGVLVSGVDDKSELTVEVVSEDLLRSWKRLLEWIGQDREFILWRQLLQNRAAEWKNKDHLSTFLLEGEALREAQKWRTSRTRDLSDGELTYIRASEFTIERVKQRSLMTWSVAAVLLVAVLGGFFLIKTYVSYRARKKANENLLQQALGIIQSSASLPGKLRVDQLQLGILLELEADRLSPSPTTEALINQHLSLLPRNVVTIPQNRNVQRVALSDQGDRLVAILGRSSPFSGPLEEKTLVIHDLASRKQITSFPFQASSSDVILSHDGRFLAYMAPAGNRSSIPNTGPVTQVIWDSKNNTSLAMGLPAEVYDEVFSPDGRYLVLATKAGTQVIDLPLSFAKHEITREGTLSDDVPSEGVDFDNNGQHLAIVLRSNTVVVRRVLPDKGPSNELLRVSSEWRAQLSFSGNLLGAVDLYGKSIVVWDVRDQHQVATFQRDEFGEFVFTSDDKMLVSVGKGVTAWDLASQQASNVALDNDLNSVFGSRDGRYIAAIGGNQARVWRYSEGKFVEAAIIVVQGTMNDLSFSRGSLITTGGSDNNIHVWDLSPPSTAKPDEKDYCARLTRNLTNDEWQKYLPSESYHEACRASANAETK